MNIYIYIYIYVCIYVYTYRYIYIHLHACICTHTYIYICIHMYIYVYIYMYTYTHIYVLYMFYIFTIWTAVQTFFWKGAYLDNLRDWGLGNGNKNSSILDENKKPHRFTDLTRMKIRDTISSLNWHTCTYSYMRVCVYACVYVCIYIQIFMYMRVCLCVCRHVCVRVCLYVCMYVRKALPDWRVLPCTNESWHKWMCHVAPRADKTLNTHCLIGTSRHMKDSYHTHKWVMAQMNESWHTLRRRRKRSIDQLESASVKQSIYW